MDTVIQMGNEAGAFFCGHAARMLIQSGLLILILVGLDRLLVRRVRASVRYGIWMLALAKLMLPTTLSFPTGAGYWLSMPTFSSSQSSPLQETESVSPAEATAQAPLPPAESQPVPSKALVAVPQAPVVIETAPEAVPVLDLSWQAFLFGGWLIGVLVLSAAFGIRLVMVGRIVRQSRLASDRCRKIFAECGGRPEALLESDQVSSPAVCGLLRPTVLMPAGLEDKLTDDQLHSVLLHERGHIQRGDLWINLLQTLLQILYFYNPFVWLANHSIRRIREQANDERVLVMLGGGRECYSHTLIEVARAVFGKPLPFLRLIGVMETKTQLNERIKHMIQRPIPKTSRLGWTGLAAVTVLAGLLLPMAQGQPRSVSGSLAMQNLASTAVAVTADQQKMLDEFERTTENLLQAVNNGNLNRILSMYTENAIRLPNQAEAAVGREGLTQLYMKFFRENPGLQVLNLQNESQELWVAGDTVFAIARYSVTFKSPAMRYVMTDYQKDISVYLRQPDGSYKMEVGADNSDPAPADARQYQADKEKSNVVIHTVETQALSADQMAKNIEAVKALDLEFHECFVRHDADAALNYYAEDAMLLPLNQNIVRGKTSLSSFIKDGMKEAELINNNQQILDAGGTDGMIYILNQFNWQFKTPDNPQEIQSFPGKGIHVWQKQPDGQWKILLDLYNISIPLPEA